ncbi:MAG: sulfotransferase domain-containing protein [Actinomycetota bacterium]|nr:sulfotransferase domain-containing protein [Actinomycetota bacterium]
MFQRVRNGVRRRYASLRHSLRKPPDTFLCSYPKSGRTWLRFMIATYLADANGLGIDVDFQNLFWLVPADTSDPVRGRSAYRFRNDDRIPEIVTSHLEFDANAGPFSKRPVVFVVRDPRDLLVSKYFSRRFRERGFDGPLSDFVRDEVEGIPNLVHYLNSWADRLERDDALVVSYEALSSDTPNELARVLSFAGVEVEDRSLDRAIEAGAFDRMKELEAKVPIPSYPYDVSDPNAARMRKGKVGGHADHLDEDDVAYIRFFIEDHLAPKAQRLFGIHPTAWSDHVPDRAAVVNEPDRR